MILGNGREVTDPESCGETLKIVAREASANSKNCEEAEKQGIYYQRENWRIPLSSSLIPV